MSLKPIIILGGGGHARVVADTLRACKADVLGFVDKDPLKTTLDGLRRLGAEEYILESCNADEVVIANGIGSVGWPGDRYEWFIRLSQSGYNFTSVIHPTATLSPLVHLGRGVQVMARAVVQPGVHLEVNTIVNTGAIVDHDCQIGAHVHIGPGAVLSGNVTVGDCAHIGTGASVIEGINIGAESIVGAGSVVIRDVKDKVIVAGVPAVKKA